MNLCIEKSLTTSTRTQPFSTVFHTCAPSVFSPFTLEWLYVVCYRPYPSRFLLNNKHLRTVHWQIQRSFVFFLFERHLLSPIWEDFYQACPRIWDSHGNCSMKSDKKVDLKFVPCPIVSNYITYSRNFLKLNTVLNMLTAQQALNFSAMAL